jgi:hypothetical protein
MNLTLANATLQDNMYSWSVSLPYYKIQSIMVITNTYSFYAKYNNTAEQYLESGRTDSCPAILSGNFSVLFSFSPMNIILTDIQDLQITLVPHVEATVPLTDETVL